jgi:hypothetical protein
MSETSLICKNHKVFLKKIEWYPKKKVHISNEKDVTSDLLFYLGETIEIENDFTFGDLLRPLEKYHTSLDVFFGKELGHFPIKPFFKELNKPTSPPVYPNEKGDIVERLEVCWICETNDYSDKETFSLYSHVYGVGKTKRFGEEDSGKLENVTWSVSFDKLNKLAFLPLKLHHEFDIFTFSHNCKIKHIKKNVIRHFTLQDVLKAIFFEISWYGLPKDRDKEFKKLKKIVKNVKKELSKNKTLTKEKKQ